MPCQQGDKGGTRTRQKQLLASELKVGVYMYMYVPLKMTSHLASFGAPKSSVVDFPSDKQHRQHLGHLPRCSDHCQLWCFCKACLSKLNIVVILV